METLPSRAGPGAPAPDPTTKALLEAYPKRSAVSALMARLHDHHAPSARHSARVGQVLHAMWVQAPAFLGDPGTTLVAGLLHDIGKLRVPAETLDSPAGLDAAGRALIRAHPAEGAAILAEEGFPDPIVDVARWHHERWRGGGYPTGQPAAQLPRLAAAVAVADALVAMVEPGRSYRIPLRRDAALAELEACADHHFDPDATRILLAALAAPDGAMVSVFGT